MSPILSAAIMLGLKGLGSLFGGKSREAQYDENRDSTIAAMNIKQKMSEDQRRARLALAQSLLNGVPGSTAGGNVRTNVALDPALYELLNQERTYDFGSAVPEHAGGTSAFLSGLFGGAAETIPYMGSPLATPTAATPSASPTTPQGGNPFGDPNFSLAPPTVTLDDLRTERYDEEEDD